MHKIDSYIFIYIIIIIIKMNRPHKNFNIRKGDPIKFKGEYYIIIDIIFESISKLPEKIQLGS